MRLAPLAQGKLRVVENGADGEAATYTGRPKAERTEMS
jgi:hypothetical protein